MSHFSRIFAPILVITLFGAGCNSVSTYVPGDVPTEVQLERMTPAEKEAGMRAMLEREPLPELTDGQARGARMEAIEAMRDGVVERFANFEAAILHEVSGSVRIVREGEKLKVVLSEDFSVTPGPYLVVRVSGREIATLASTNGAQTYIIPDDIELSSIDQVDIYCKPFHFVFASATFGN